MESRYAESLIRILNRRRENLGISQARLAKMVGVSLPTMQRFFSGQARDVRFETIAKVAEVLGMSMGLQETMSESALTLRQAKERAKKLAQLVQGTSSLEKQGLSDESLESIENQFMLDLLKMPNSHLWSE